MTASEIFERFYAFEGEERLFDRVIGSVRYWPLVRFNVYTKLVLPHFVAMGDAHPDSRNARPKAWTLGLSAAKLARRFREGVLANPLHTTRKADILYALTPRTARLADGRLVRQILDLVQERVESPSAILEYPQADGSYIPALPGPHVLCAGAALRKARRIRNAPSFLRLRAEMDAEAAFLAGRLRDSFGLEGVEGALKKRLASAVASDLGLTPLWRQMLRRLGTRCVVTVVHYINKNMCLAKAAHELGIPVVELQHGTVYPEHAAYNLTKPVAEYAPDYLFTWGDHWSAQTRNYARIASVSMGYPFLESFLSAARNEHVRTGPRRQVLFVSQGTIGASLSRIAVELRGLLEDGDWTVVYKLHPDESRRWRELYPWLLDSGVEVVENTSRSVYSLFGEVNAVAGVHSTALIEGLMWGLPTFVFRDLAGGDTMSPFFRPGSVDPVLSAAELADRLRKLVGDPARTAPADAEHFWKPNAAATIATTLDEIVEKGTLAI